jgi:hypothetical protein
MPSEIFLILSEVEGRTAKRAAPLSIVQLLSIGLLRSFAQPAFAISTRPPM